MKNTSPLPSPAQLRSDPNTEIVGTKSLAALWCKFHKANREDEHPPKNAINANGYAKMFKMTKAQADSFLKSQSLKGKLKTRKFRVLDSGGYLRSTRFWWLA